MLNRASHFFGFFLNRGAARLRSEFNLFVRRDDRHEPGCLLRQQQLPIKYTKIRGYAAGRFIQLGLVGVHGTGIIALKSMPILDFELP